MSFDNVHSETSFFPVLARIPKSLRYSRLDKTIHNVYAAEFERALILWNILCKYEFRWATSWFFFPSSGLLARVEFSVVRDGILFVLIHNFTRRAFHLVHTYESPSRTPTSVSSRERTGRRLDSHARHCTSCTGRFLFCAAAPRSSIWLHARTSETDFQNEFKNDFVKRWRVCTNVVSRRSKRFRSRAA